jgi:hypothetical protein
VAEPVAAAVGMVAPISVDLAPADVDAEQMTLFQER